MVLLGSFLNALFIILGAFVGRLFKNIPESMQQTVMAIIGALDSGLRNDHNVLITKGIIDGFKAIILASTLGIGVMLSTIPVFLYQDAIALFAGIISTYAPTEVLNLFIKEMTATGDIMILAIGLNITGLTKIRIANLLPTIIVVGIVVAVIFPFQ